MSELKGRRFFVEQALKAACQIKGTGTDWINLGVVQGALEHLLERWDAWEEVEQQYKACRQGGPNGQANVGAGSHEAGGTSRCDFCGSLCEDVQTGDGHGRRWDDGLDEADQGSVTGYIIGKDGSSEQRGVLYRFDSAIKLAVGYALVELLDIGVGLENLI